MPLLLIRGKLLVKDGELPMIFKAAILQMRSAYREYEQNIKTIIRYMSEAKKNNADILLLPECFITNHRCPPGLACRVRDRTGRICFGNDLCIVALYASKTKSTAEALRRCFCFAEVSTGHPHPLRRRVPFGLSVGVIIPH